MMQFFPIEPKVDCFAGCATTYIAEKYNPIPCIEFERTSIRQLGSWLTISI